MSLSSSSSSSSSADQGDDDSNKTSLHQTINVVVAEIQSELIARSDSQKAPAMQKYMKTDMPFYGVQKQQRAVIAKALFDSWEQQIQQSKEYSFIFQTDTEQDEETEHDGAKRTAAANDLYRRMLQTLWNLPHREEKYLAIDFATHYTKLSKRRRRNPNPLTVDGYFFVDDYLEMLRADFMWWDLCDPLATHVLGPILLQHRSRLEPQLRRDWLCHSKCLWIRRTALLAQLNHKQETDEALLWDSCRVSLGSHEFFIQKATGWVLREYSKTSPDRVHGFLKRHGTEMSGLTYREASKHLKKSGYPV